MSVERLPENSSPAEESMMSGVSGFPAGQLHELRSARGHGISIQGRGRSQNQDSFLLDPSGRYFVIADGVGGVPGGEAASQLACDTLSNALAHLAEKYDADSPLRQITTPSELTERIRNDLLAAVKSANDAIVAEREDAPWICEMGTTAVVALIMDGYLFLASIGDSRAYLLRSGRIEQLTRDHTMTAGLVDMGLLTPEQAATHHYRNTLYKYLGGWCDTDPADVEMFELRPDDCLILVTDGITDCLTDDEIADSSGGFSGPEHAAAEIVGTALEHGETDDMTCVVVYVEQNH